MIEDELFKAAQKLAKEHTGFLIGVHVKEGKAEAIIELYDGVQYFPLEVQDE